MRSNLFDHLPIVHEQHRNFQEQYTILRKEKYEIYYRSSEVIDLIWFLLCTLNDYTEVPISVEFLIYYLKNQGGKKIWEFEIGVHLVKDWSFSTSCSAITLVL